MAVKTWVWVVLALVGVAVLGLIALIGAGAYFVAREIDTKPASKLSAEQEFAKELERFGDQKPLIEIDETGHSVSSRFDPSLPAAATKPEVMIVMVWDPDDERIVRVRLPFWLLRLGNREKGGSMRIGPRNTITFENLNISVQDLERLGPALIVSHHATRGERVLVWTQ